MLRRAPLLLALATVIILTSFADAKAEEARGPKIFGLQVGMPWEEAVQVARSYAEKHGLSVKEFSSDHDEQLCVYKDNGSYHDSYIRLSHVSGGKLLQYLKQMNFYPRAFNVEIIDADKLKKIFDRYGIPFDKVQRIPAGLGYENGDEGYEMFFLYDVLHIKLIQKSSEMTLE